MSDTDKTIPQFPPRQPPWPAPLVAPLPEGRFNRNEEWAWARIANGMDADMAFYSGDEVNQKDEDWLTGRQSERPDPNDISSFKPQHKLSELFLRTILFHEPWASAPERPSIQIFHALIEDAIDWSVRETKAALWFFRCHFAQEMNWRRLQVRGVLSLESSVLAGALEADGLQVDDDFFCRNGFVAEKDIRLISSRIGGDADFSGATLKGVLSAHDLRAHGTLFCSGAFVAENQVVLLGARIGGQVDFAGATLKGVLDASRLRVEGSLFCTDGFVAENNVILRSASVGSNAGFTGATFKAVFDGAGIQVDRFLYMRGMKRLGATSLAGAKIGKDLQLLKSQIDGEIDLTGATIAGELHLDQGGDEAHENSTLPDWGDGAKLILRNASAASVAGRLDAFRHRRENANPRRSDFVDMDLTGFRYQRLGGFKAAHKDTIAAAEAKHLIAWLEAGCGDGAFNPDPYRQLARALEASGDMGKARRILRAMAAHEHRAANGWRRVPFFFSWLFIDYGYSNLRALLWFLGLVLVFTALGFGTEVSRGFAFGASCFDEFFRWLGFSFANAVPLMSFDKAHETFLAAQFGNESDPASVPVGIAWAFYAEKVLGFIILTYLAAGLSGLAHRRVEKD